jgi:antitoxin CptB
MSKLSEQALPSLGQLRWRCRRGMRELDVLLLEYLEQRYSRADPAEQKGFVALLELQDPVLYAYMTGRDTPADPILADVIGKITAPH